jgi:hypothetical protein
MVMDKHLILQSAIIIAMRNGWVKPRSLPSITPENLALDALRDIPYWQGIVYSHDFAKALWGTEEDQFMYPESEGVAPNDNQKQAELCWQEIWRYHLQQMVISDDPIAYLAENMLEDKR